LPGKSVSLQNTEKASTSHDWKVEITVSMLPTGKITDRKVRVLNIPTSSLWMKKCIFFRNVNLH
jgi:hypothetical protein